MVNRRGVNMFYMLACRLPFTVVAFSIPKLREKIRNREIATLPIGLSDSAPRRVV